MVFLLFFLLFFFFSLFLAAGRVIIGLDHEKKYETEEERSTMRYGRVMLMTDQDHDGRRYKIDIKRMCTGKRIQHKHTHTKTRARVRLRLSASWRVCFVCGAH